MKSVATRFVLVLLLFCGLTHFSSHAEGNEDGQFNAFQAQQRQGEIADKVKKLDSEIMSLGELKAEYKNQRKQLSTLEDSLSVSRIIKLKKQIQELKIEECSKNVLAGFFSEYEKICEVKNKGLNDLGNEISGKLYFPGPSPGYKGEMENKFCKKLAERINEIQEKQGLVESFLLDSQNTPVMDIDFQMASISVPNSFQFIQDRKQDILGSLEKLEDENFSESWTKPLDLEFAGLIKEIDQEIKEKEEAKIILNKEGETVFNQIQSKQEGQFKIDQILVWTLPLYGLLMALMLLIPKFYAGESIRQAIFGSGLILQLITVYLLTATILILGIGEKISSEVLGTLIGGISGYVLGRNMKGGKQEGGGLFQQSKGLLAGQAKSEGTEETVLEAEKSNSSR